MDSIDFNAIKKQAMQMRAAEMSRLEGIAAERLWLVGRLMAGSVKSGLLGLSQALRPLFSWNPRPLNH